MHTLLVFILYLHNNYNYYKHTYYNAYTYSSIPSYKSAVYKSAYTTYPYSRIDTACIQYICHIHTVTLSCAIPVFFLCS